MLVTQIGGPPTHGRAHPPVSRGSDQTAAAASGRIRRRVMRSQVGSGHRQRIRETAKGPNRRRVVSGFFFLYLKKLKFQKYMSILENFKNIPRSPYEGATGFKYNFFFFKFTTRSLTGGAQDGGPVAPSSGDRGPHPQARACRSRGGRQPGGPCACVGCMLNFLCPGALQLMSFIRVVSSVGVMLPVLDRTGPSLAALVPRVRIVAIQYCSTIYLCAILVLIFLCLVYAL